MAIITLRNVEDNSLVEVISFNIDESHNVLIMQDESLQVIPISDFKDMILGTNGDADNDALQPTHVPL